MGIDKPCRIDPGQRGIIDGNDVNCDDDDDDDDDAVGAADDSNDYD